MAINRGGGADFMPIGYEDESITVEDLTNPNVQDFLITAAQAMPNQSGIINAMPNIINRPGVTTREGALIDGDDPMSRYGVQQNFPSSIDPFTNTVAPAPTAPEMYEDLIMNPDYMPNRLQNIERNIAIDNMPYEEIPGFNFIDAPTSLTSRLQNLEYINNPRTGLIDNTILARGNPNKGISLNPLAIAAGLINPALGFAVNVGSKMKSGLGSLGTKLGDFRERTTGYRTQAEYDQARTERQQQNRTDRMIDRITKGKPTRSNPRDAGTTQAQKDAISAALQESRRGQQYTDKDSSGSGGTGGGKVVCTMMNERYGFGSFRNKIWMKFHESYGPEYQKGYHAIFLPLVKIAKGEGKINTAVRKVLEHMGRHVTADMFKIMKGKKRDPLGRIYRAIFEPTCRIIGKIKSALGRG